MEKRTVYAPLIDALLQTAERHPNKVLFVFREGRKTVAAITGRELSAGVAAAGAVLQQSLVAQERVLLILPQGIDFIYSLLACFYANVVAIPAPAADPRQPDLVQRTLSLLEHAAAGTIITTGSFHERLAESIELDSITLLDVQELITPGNEPLPAREIGTDDLALLFYTSGSTSAPKGVMTTHAQLFAQADAGRQQWKITDHSCIVSWMPQFHNLGLNFGILAPLISSASSVLSAPGGFATSPEDWFYNITLFQGTHTAAPNFAFDLACNMVGDNALADVELSSLEAIVCGGEPVRKATYDAFFNKFSAAGLRQHVFCPHYGLSETGSASTIVPGEGIRTLSLDIAALEEGRIVYSSAGEKHKDIISCGPIPEGAIILCVDPVTSEPCAAGVAGEIWLRTQGTASGYFQLSEETAATFGAVIKGGEDIRFLRTGDLGFIEDNHLYITGRLKEVIIVNGKNYHPVDIEWTVKKYLSQLTLPLAVFADEQDGRDRVVVVQEVAADKPAAYYESVSLEILAAVAEVHTLDVSRIILAAPGSIPRTASGKVQRRACRDAFKKGQLSPLFEFATGHSVAVEKEVSHAPVDLRLVMEILQQQVFQDIPGADANRLSGLKIWGELGLNSLQYVNIAQRIATAFNRPFAPPMLFKYRNVAQLANYLYPQGMGNVAVTTHTAAEPEQTAKHQYNQKDIAIIGMHCQLPGGVNCPADLWQLLLEGRDAIRPEGAGQRLASANNWTAADFPQFGGYLEDVAGFDHTFFHISPLEAESMDPQQRKALELSWHVLEHGGYDPYALAGAPVGIYLGVHSNDYAELAATKTDVMSTYGAFLDSGLHPTMIANRVSRWFDFHGPSEVVNTACSSSLVAVHHAVNAIRKGNCNLAIAGGINILLTPRISRASHQAGMLSPDGRCKTFDEKADGFVRAEGLGAVLLKPLYQAELDGDTIYGVIRGTAVNHDGKSNSLRAPNLVAQKQVISAALADAAIPAASISYIETHGTGTALGDPIEVQALREAFEEDHAKGEAFCGLGTVKTNIGHCESAAGIAGLIKLILSMQHQQLPGILHFKRLNPFLDIAGSPFYIADATQQWQRQKDEKGNELPLRAGVSSFGFGGVNAHVILEEYTAAKRGTTAGSNGLQLIPLSARHKKQVQLQAASLLEQLTHSDEADLASVAYTLQTGRAAMESRIVFIVSDMDSLIKGLQTFLQGEPSSLFLEGQQSVSAMLSADDEDVLALLQQWFRKGKPEKIAAYWINGGYVAWKALYEGQTPVRTALPLYPFRRDQHWLRTGETQQLMTTQLHPLLHENISDFYGQRFRSSFTGREYYFSEHVIHQHKTLPAAAFIELIREGLQRSAHQTGAVVIEDICWLRPLYATDGMDVITRIEAAHDDFSFEVYSEVYDNVVVYCQGRAHFATIADAVIDLAEVRQNCNHTTISPDTYYDAFRNAGIVYGPAFSRIAAAYTGKGQVLASLAALSSGPASENVYGVSPVMLDAALQTVTALDFQHFLPEGAPAAIPFAISTVTLNRLSDELSFAWARYNDAGTIDIDVCDESGHVGISVRGLQLVRPEGLPATDNETLLFTPVWEEKSGVKNALPDRRIIWLSQETGNYEDTVKAALPESEVNILVSPSADTAERLTDYTVLLLKRIQQLLQQKEAGNTLLQIILPDDHNGHLYGSLAALLKTIQAEQPSISGQLIITDDPQGIAAMLHAENSGDDHVSVRYQQGVRKVQTWEEQTTTVTQSVWREHGVYLITGGAGSIGTVFLTEITSKLQQAVVYVSGRSAIAENAFAAFKKPRLNIIYRQTDITDQQQVISLIREIRTNHGTLNGIIHSAGLIRDNYIFSKDLKDVPAVLAPKVAGIRALDEATKDLPLDFMVFFSSVAGSLGSAGQADYAVANAFMDQYAAFRNGLCRRGQRAGRTLSVNWPLWDAGGMKMEQTIQQQLYAATGMLAMSSAAGLHAFYRAMELSCDQVMVLSGERRRLLEMIHRERKNKDQHTGKTTGQAMLDLQLEDKAVEFFASIVADALHQPKELIDADASLDKYGIDSVLITVLTGKLEKYFGPVSKTLFFEYQDLRSLTRYFVQTYGDRLSALLETSNETDAAKPAPANNKPLSPGSSRFMRTTQSSSKDRAVAIIGLSGKYAGADNINEFWHNLREGRNCITEIPAERWDWRTYFDPKRGKKESMYTRWGGFIKDIDKFDPLFFHISPVEAEKMDPQERLFLEQVYAAIEDAAYTPANLNSNRSVGVFAGVMHGLYATEAAYWSIANRVSYLFNFNGPSLAIDTACSASLTAIHLAVQSIRSGACECAIAGGVNLVTHPQHFIGLSEMTMVSSSDACRSFGANADGFVDGEGVGAIVLKPLQQAIEDGDHIYGVITGTAINAGGKTNGFTVPNPVAQAQVVSAALKDAGISARSVSYIEAHGTGTALGDPIEINGLSRAFDQDTSDRQYCAIGSVKSNIGHCESAAGIAGLSKILLQMKHGLLAPSLHATATNPNIDFNTTPFRLQQTLAPWTGRRIAGISSFGAGGSNAHLIIESYTPFTTAVIPENGPVIIVLSGRTADRLQELAMNLLLSLSGDDAPADPAAVAFTLQTGREAMEERLAMIVTSIDELKTHLTLFLAGDTDGCFTGQASVGRTEAEEWKRNHDADIMLRRWMQEKDYVQLCQWWVKGLTIDWNGLYNTGHPERISLPGYPFARERYWLENKENDLLAQLLDDMLNDNISIAAAAATIRNAN